MKNEKIPEKMNAPRIPVEQHAKIINGTAKITKTGKLLLIINFILFFLFFLFFKQSKNTIFFETQILLKIFIIKSKK